MKNKNVDMVSVIIPTYKGSCFLKRAVDSVLHQSYSNIEIIVVDDNNPNTDERLKTSNIMKDYVRQKENIIYIQHEKNMNGSVARNTGIKNSSGEYIMFLDDDDEMLPQKVEKQLSCMKNKGKEWGVSYTGYIRKYKNRIVARSAEKREGNLYLEELMRNFFVHAGSNLMLRRSVVIEAQGFDETFLRNQDIEFLSRVLEKYKILYVDYVGLIVHTKARKKNVDFIKTTEIFLEKFGRKIDKLETNEKKKVYQMIGLQKIRYYVLNKKFKLAKQILKKEKIKRRTVIRYFFHLLKRKVTKKVYGFKL